MTRLLLVLLVCLPATALAGSNPASGPGETPRIVQLRHGTVGGDCRIAAGPDERAKVDRWSPELGGPQTRRAARILLRQGRPGCDAVLAWLSSGASGADGRVLADSARTLAERGDQAQVEALLGLLDHDSEQVSLALLEGLEKRLAVLDETTTSALLQDARPGVAAATLPLLAGYHSEGRVRFVDGVPTWEETAFWGAPDEPPAWYVDALEELIDRDDVELRRLAAKYLARHGREDHPCQVTWGRLLARLTSGRDEAAALAAEGLGWSEPPALYPVESDLLQDPTATRHLLDGMEGRLTAGRGTQETLDRLERIAASGGRGQPLRAERMLKRWRQRLEGRQQPEN